jgi:hypothetical protein
MFVAVDQEVGAAFGPFDSNENAVLWVRDRLLDTQVIALSDEIAAMAAGRNSIEAIQEDLMSMKWFIYEVECVEAWPPEEYRVEYVDLPTLEDLPPEEAESTDWPLSRLYGEAGPSKSDEEPKDDNPFDSAYGGGSYSQGRNL